MHLTLKQFISYYMILCLMIILITGCDSNEVGLPEDNNYSGILEGCDSTCVDAQFLEPVSTKPNNACSGCDPYIRTTLVGHEPGGWSKVIGTSKTFGVHWDIRTSEPTDHIDIRIYRDSDNGSKYYVKQFTIKPQGFGYIQQIASFMCFNPANYDKGIPQTITDVIYATYDVQVSIVDKLGRGSSISRQQLNIKYIPVNYSYTGSAYADLLAPMPGLDSSEPGDVYYFDLPKNTFESQFYDYERDGATRYSTTFRPTELIIDGKVGANLYYTNNDNISHRLISVYNPIYRETDAKRYNGDAPHSIGGVIGLDFGATGTDGKIDVLPGNTVEIKVPPSESGGRHRLNRTWTLWDFADNRGQIDNMGNLYDRTYPYRLKVRVWY